jgi:glycerophosphoryl diester phosphodiesterase
VTFEVIDCLGKTKIKRIRTHVEFTLKQHPSFHEAQNLHITDKLLEELTAAGWNNQEAPVYVQSFEVTNTSGLNHRKTIQLLSCYDVALNGFDFHRS